MSMHAGGAATEVPPLSIANTATASMHGCVDPMIPEPSSTLRSTPVATTSTPTPVATNPAATTTTTPSTAGITQPQRLVAHAGSNRYGTAATFPVAYHGMLHPPENPLHDIVATRVNVPEHKKSHGLRQLRLSHLVSSSSEAILAFLARFPALESLELMFCERVTSAALEPLATLSTLQRLVLYACPRVDKNISPRVATVPALRELDLSNCVHARDALLLNLAGVTPD